ncbi:MAG: hypothetical protein AB7R55_05245 [Gemmatimonadales bacterium]
MTRTFTGHCIASYAFEVGRDLDLERAASIAQVGERQSVRVRNRVPRHFDYRPPPLQLQEPGPNLTVGGFPTGGVGIVLYDFGAMAINYSIPFEADLPALVRLSSELEASSLLLDDARQRVDRLVTGLSGAISRPLVAPLVEDYFIFELAPGDGAGPAPGESLLEAAGPLAARILRNALEPLSDEEIADALRVRFSFGRRDVTIIDWNAAIVLDAEPEDVRVLLEFANVQLLQLRYLDQELDQAVDDAYELLAAAERGGLRGLRPPSAAFRRLGELQMDGAVLFERVSNALKLVGDQFLSRVYGGVSERFHFGAWDRAIARKLEVIDGVYQKLSDRVMGRRLEVLEWIVIILIAVEVVLGLLGGFG